MNDFGDVSVDTTSGFSANDVVDGTGEMSQETKEKEEVDEEAAKLGSSKKGGFGGKYYYSVPRGFDWEDGEEQNEQD